MPSILTSFPFFLRQLGKTSAMCLLLFFVHLDNAFLKICLFKGVAGAVEGGDRGLW